MLPPRAKHQQGQRQLPKLTASYLGFIPGSPYRRQETQGSLKQDDPSRRREKVKEPHHCHMPFTHWPVQASSPGHQRHPVRVGGEILSVVTTLADTILPSATPLFLSFCDDPGGGEPYSFAVENLPTLLFLLLSRPSVPSPLPRFRGSPLSVKKGNTSRS